MAETSSLLPRSRQTTDNSYGVAGAGVSQYKPPGDQWGRGDGPPRTLDRAPDPQSAQASRPGVSSGTASQPLGPAGAHWPDSKGTQYSSLDPAPDTRDPKHHRQSHLNPAPENRGPKAVVQHVPVLDAAPEPVNREWQNAPPVYPGYGAVPSTYPSQQAVVKTPPRPVKTSKNFRWSTAGDNHYYVAICLIITHLICFNPLGLCCACAGFHFARKSAALNDGQGDLELARKHHKSAACFNIGAGVTFIVTPTLLFGIAGGLLIPLLNL